MKRFYCFSHSGILISLPQHNFQVKRCPPVANTVWAYAWRPLLPFALSALSSSMRRAKLLPLPILFEGGRNWNLKLGFWGQYGQNTIFQTKWTKNTDKLKTYLVWFSSTVWRRQFALKFFAQNIWKENITKYLCYFHKFSVHNHLHEHYCTFKQVVGETLI